MTNNRKSQDIFALVVAALVIGATLPYAKLIEPLAGETNNGPEATLDGESFLGVFDACLCKHRK